MVAWDGRVPDGSQKALQRIMRKPDVIMNIKKSIIGQALKKVIRLKKLKDTDQQGKSVSKGSEVK